MKRIAFKIISDDTAITYYVGKKRRKNLVPFIDICKAKIKKLVIDKSMNSYICDVCPGGWGNYTILNNAKIKCTDHSLANKSDEYCDNSIIHIYKKCCSNSNYFYKKINKLIVTPKVNECQEPKDLTGFYIGTECQFKACKMPKRRPNYISYDRYGEVSSMYWYGTDSKGSYVIRYSNHWSKISKNIKSGDKDLFQCQAVSSCWWTLVGNTATKCGKAYASDFKKRVC